jgi:imidazolonepropionase-like amidohydrolase
MKQVLTGARVLVGPVGEVVDDAAVVVDGPTISWVGTTAELPAEHADASRRDFPGATLMPGMIDSHVHLGFDGGPDPVARMKAETDAEQLVLMLRSARELLGVGVTTARDLGARNFLDVVVRDAIAAGTARGPRMLVANRPVTVTGGHCWFMGGEADGVEEVRKIVRLHHRQGADWIKVMSTGGFMTAGSAPWNAQFSDEELAVIVAEAHRVGHKVAAHSHGAAGIKRVVKAGVDTIEHCSFVLEPESAASNPFEVRRVFDPEQAELMVQKGIAVCPTVNVHLKRRRAELGAEWGEHLVKMRDMGVRIIAGTDSGINNCPHYEYVGGLESYAELGFDPAEIISMATDRAADTLGVGAVTGRLTPGLEADLIVVDGDPRQDISLLNKLHLVMARGEDYRPDSGNYDLVSGTVE